MASEADKLLAGLRSSPKTVPCSYLYDSRGSALYDQIVDLPEYYPYRTELDMLEEHAADILRQVPTGSVIVELGCGSATKTATLLRALLQRDGPDNCYFEGIDVSQAFLDAAKANLVQACKGLQAEKTGTICKPYLQGLQEARDRHPDKVLCVLWLGSSIGNLEPGEALQFFRDILRIGGSQTQVFLCADLWKDANVLEAAYHDSQSVTEAFIKNGLANALSELGLSQESPDLSSWPYHVIVNAELQQVEMWLEAPETLTGIAPGVNIKRGERILMEVSRKFTQDKLRSLAFQSGFFWQASWNCPLYSMQMLSAPSVALKACWIDEDAFFNALPDWSKLPISVRHPFCFYYAHMASFAKLKAFPEEEASVLDVLFSRGIDPDVEDPTKCHSHPDIPQSWPAKHEIVAYVQQVRQQMLAGVDAGTVSTRAVYISLEHDRMHLETLHYMLLQQRKQDFQAALAAGKVEVVDAACMLPAADDHTRSNGHTEPKYVSIPAGKVTLGRDMDPSKSFCWDNEGPIQEPEHVEAFKVAAQPVSVQEFLGFVTDPEGYSNPVWWSEGDHKLFNGPTGGCPASWTVKDGKAWVHSMSGTQGWRDAAQQPAWVSLAEANAFCRCKGVRVMSEPEYCRILNTAGDRVQQLHDGGWELLSTPFMPLAGFKAMDDYPEYSADFFDGKHYVLRGSSPATHSSVRRASFRNFYQGQYGYQFSKFRCCEGASTHEA